MGVFQRRIRLHTRGHGQVQDVTGLVQDVVAESKIETGLANVFNMGSTGAVGTIECEPGLCHDLPEALDRLIPPGREYGHEAAWADGNAHSHLQATLLGPSLTIPVYKGKLLLGTWQQIVHLECDVKPRSRELVVTVIGD